MSEYGDHPGPCNPPGCGCSATAYDYQAQEWRNGPEAERLLIEQTRDELEQLTGEGRERYAAFIGLRSEHVDSRIAALRAQGLSASMRLIERAS